MPRCPLTMEERVEIRLGIDRKDSCVVIGERLGRHGTTVSQEMKRNLGRRRYDPVRAQRRADRLRRRPKKSKLIADPQLAKTVQTDLRLGFSPAGIAARLRAAGGPTVVAETIYQALYSRTFRGLTLLPAQCLRSRRHRRNPPNARHSRELYERRRAQLRPIRDRPVGAGDRTEPGHWEGDLIVGPHSDSAVVTLIERVSRYTLLAPLPQRHTAAEVAEALVALLQELPPNMLASLAWDQGSEMVGNGAHLECALGMPVYFCDPHSPWQRPSNENLNRQLRFWMPKGTDLRQHDRVALDRITNVLNNQPRKLFNWETPSQRYAALTMP